MDGDVLQAQLKRLLTGLAAQAIESGQDFFYDSGKLYADDVAEVALPSILCIAQDLSQRLGLGDFGYRFHIGEANPLFPLHASRGQPTPPFFAVAPFVTQVFEVQVLDCRQDLAFLFEAAAKRLHPEFSLATHSAYPAAPPNRHATTERSAAPESKQPAETLC